MDLALVSARLLLAAVFAVAGVTKLADRAGSRQTLLDFGVPTTFAAPFALALPLAEVAIAVALLPVATAWWGALLAFVLLVLFMTAIGVNLARGRAPSCRCFGQIASGPVGRSTLVRNAVLAAVAGLVIWQGQVTPGSSVMGWVVDLTTAERITLAGGLVVVALLAATVALLVQMLGQQGRLLLRLEQLERRLEAGGALATADQIGAESDAPEGLPIGVPAPRFQLLSLQGEELTLAGLQSATSTVRGQAAAIKPVLLVFVDPDCGPCTALMPDLGRWQDEHATQLGIAVISRGTADANRAKAAEHGVAPVLLQRDYEVADLYRVFATPSAVLVRADGSIGSPVAAGPEQIRALVAHTLTGVADQPWAEGIPLPMLNGHAHDHPARPMALKIGEPARPLILPDLDGALVDLADFRGSDTLVLFWSPACGFCQQMLPELRAWEADPPPDAPKLLVVSSGQAEENRALGLRAQIVLDQEFRIGSSFGADGTPSAVLIGGDGKVASDLAIGAPPVLALAGLDQHPTARSAT